MAAGATRTSAQSAAHLDQAWLRGLVEALASIHRPTASPGERVAAEWVADAFGSSAPTDARVERRATCTGPSGGRSGLAARRGVVAGLLALRGRRAGRRGARRRGRPGRGGRPAAREAQAALRCCRSEAATTVVGELGPPDAERTVVLVAHHDAAHAGPALPPGDPRARLRPLPWLIERVDTSPPLMAPVGGDTPAGRGRGRAPAAAALIKAGTALAAALGGGARRHRPARDGSRRQRQRHRRGGAAGDRAGSRGAPRRERARDARVDLGGGDVRGDAGLRRAPLPGPAPREHLLPLPSTRWARRTCWSCGARG